MNTIGSFAVISEWNACKSLYLSVQQSLVNNLLDNHELECTNILHLSDCWMMYMYRKPTLLQSLTSAGMKTSVYPRTASPKQKMRVYNICDQDDNKTAD